MGKRNKIRYQSKPKDRKTLTLSGQVYLQYEDEESLPQAKKGDLLVYPHNDALNSTRQGDYYSTGFSGYFKVDVFEGNVWCLVLVNDIFPEGEHHFSKTECPIDTYELIAEILRALAGKTLTRTYREHYMLADEEDEPAKEPK
jgi:hypothetical protein